MARFDQYSVDPNGLQKAHNVLLDQLNKAWSSGYGDVFGPSTVVDSNFAAFNGTSGKVIKDSGFNSASFLRSTGGVITGGLQIGNSSDYVSVSTVGGVRLNGVATVYEDEACSLSGSRISAPGAKVTNSTNNDVIFSTSCPITDYVEVNLQLQHKRKIDTAIYPHIHWRQGSTSMPNWSLRYRWQHMGSLLSGTWVYSTVASNLYTWTTATLNQISSFTPISPTTNDDLSGILQFKLTRDSDNTSLTFGSTDPYSTSVNAYFLDVHYEIDSLGSNQELIK